MNDPVNDPSVSAQPEVPAAAGPSPAGGSLDSLKTLTHVIYGLYALAIVIGLSSIVAIVMNYVKKDDVAGTFLATHFRWQMRTFWFSLLWAVVGWITIFIAVGWAVWCAAGIWYIYRIVKGWLYLNDGKPMY